MDKDTINNLAEQIRSNVVKKAIHILESEGPAETLAGLIACKMVMKFGMPPAAYTQACDLSDKLVDCMLTDFKRATTKATSDEDIAARIAAARYTVSQIRDEFGKAN